MRSRIAWALRRLANRVDPIRWEYDETETAAFATYYVNKCGAIAGEPPAPVVAPPPPGREAAL